MIKFSELSVELFLRIIFILHFNSESSTGILTCDDMYFTGKNTCATFISRKQRMKYFFIIILIGSMISCTPTKTSTDEEASAREVPTEVITKPSCGTLATVKDNSGLDGCKFLIILDNDQRLEPLVMEDKNFEFKDGQRIRLNYETEREMMSVCMSGMGVKVTCIEEVK
jgi:hypothetical protein